MPNFRPEWSGEMEYLKGKARDRVKREVFEKEINESPDLGHNAYEIHSAFPWLSPGIVISLAKTGAPTSSRLVREAAELEFQRRTEAGEWTMQGDTIGHADTLKTTADLFGGVDHAAEETQGQEGTTPGQVQGQDGATQV